MDQISFLLSHSGCNGFEYVLEPVDNTHDAEKQTLSTGVTLWTCNKSMLYLLGTEIDWKDDIMGSRFVFIIQMPSLCVVVVLHFLLSNEP